MTPQTLSAGAWCAPCLLTLLALAVPLLAALLVMIRPAVARDALAVSALPVLLAVLFLEPGHEVGVEALMLGARFGADAWTLPMVILVALVWTAAGCALPSYAGTPAASRLAPWWLLALLGNVGLVLALDALTFFLFFALMSFAAYALVVQRMDGAALAAARRYMIFVIVGEIALFNALVLPPEDQGTLRTLLLVTGFGVKASLIGLHMWLPLAHTAAPAPASAVLSGAMIAAGVLGWLRFVEPGSIAGLGTALAILGVVGALYGTVRGVLQSRPKAVLAYSSVAQMGIVAVAVGAHLSGHSGAGAVAAWYALHHGLAKAALFLAVAVCERSGGAWRRMVIAASLLPAAAIIGLPLSSGAALKSALKDAVGQGFEPWLAEPVVTALWVAAVGSTLLMARLVVTFPAGRSVRGDAPAGLLAGWLLLIAASVVLAWVQPAVIGKFAPEALLPFLCGAALAVATLVMGRAGLLPGIASTGGTSGTAGTDGAPVIRPTRGGSRLLSSLAMAPARLQRPAAALLRRCDALWADLEDRARRWVAPGLALTTIVLVTALSQFLSAS